MDISPWFLAASLSGLACAALSLAVIFAGWNRRVPEVAFLGSGLFSLSIFAAAFGFSVTSLGGGLPESPLTALLALPTAVITTIPLLVPSARPSRFIARHWQAWVVFCAATNIIGAISTVGSTADPGLLLTSALIGTGVLGSLLLARRQVFLYRVSGQVTALAAAAAIASLTVSTSLSHTFMPGSSISWVLLTVENAAVFTAGAAIIVGYRNGQGVAEVLRPVLSSEPLAALEVGMSPEVQSFVAALETRDQITRDHVVRTSALAMRVAIRAGLPSTKVREVALGALLHDIGKLVVPSDLIKKPGRLTDEEFATIQTHPEQGERLLQGSPALAGAAPYVRGHHERVDGGGYPDGLSGDDVSFEVGLVAVSDAWDAMTHTRQYRKGMGAERATEILRKGAGSQWRADAVLMLLAEVQANGESNLDAAGPIGRHDLASIQCEPSDQDSEAFFDPALACNSADQDGHICPAEESSICCSDAVGPDLLTKPKPGEGGSQDSDRTRSMARPRVVKRSDKVSPAG